MFPLSASSRVLLEGVIALALAPMAIEAVIVWRGFRPGAGRVGSDQRTSRTVRLAAAALGATLAAVFVSPKWADIDATDLAEAMRTTRHDDEGRAVDIAVLAIQQHRGRDVLPADLPATLLRAGRLGELQHYYGGLLAQDADLNTWTDLLLLARTARHSGWERMSAVDRLVARADTRPDLRAAAAVLASSVGRGTGAAPAALFASGARATNASTPLAVFEGWSARDAGHGDCDLLVFFTPKTELAGHRVWLHAYPPDSHDYLDVTAAFPASVWKSGELAWEVFRSTAPRGAGLYAGVATGGDLGPAVALGRVMECGG